MRKYGYEKLNKKKCLRINCDILGQKMERKIFYLYILNKLSVFVQLSTQIKTHLLFCENSSLNSVNCTDRVVLRVSSWKFYMSPQIFYTIATCATVTNSSSAPVPFKKMKRPKILLLPKSVIILSRNCLRIFADRFVSATDFWRTLRIHFTKEASGRRQSCFELWNSILVLL